MTSCPRGPFEPDFEQKHGHACPKGSYQNVLLLCDIVFSTPLHTKTHGRLFLASFVFCRRWVEVRLQPWPIFPDERGPDGNLTEFCSIEVPGKSVETVGTVHSDLFADAIDAST